MTPSTSMPEPGELFAAFESAEPELRRRYLYLHETVIARAERGTDILERSARHLELLAVSVCACETVQQPALRRSVVAPAVVASVETYVRQATGLDILQVLRDNAAVIEPRSGRSPVMPDWGAILRIVKSTLEFCPIDMLERIAQETGSAVLGHRCRRTYDSLRAFVLRNDDQEEPRFKILSREYAQGHITMSEVATLLGRDVVDVLATFERLGYSRTLDQIRLDESERTQILTELDADRAARDGEPAYSPVAVARDTIASERIEGVDARRWIPRGESE